MSPRSFQSAFVLFAAVIAAVGAQGNWTTQSSGVTARLRGVSAVSESVAWASGTGGTVLRTADAGVTWQRLRVAGAETLDFRDVDAISERTAYMLSIGPATRHASTRPSTPAHVGRAVHQP